MDFTFSTEHEELCALTKTLLTKSSAEAEPHGSGGFDPELWGKLVKAGIVDAALPTSVGGGGLDLIAQCGVLTQLGQELARVPYLSTVTMAAAALAEFGTPEQRERWLVPAIRGDRMLAVALSTVGSPGGFTARRQAGGWRLSGTQTAVAFGAFADGFLVPARTEDGTAVFLVEQARSQQQSVVDHADAALLELTDAPAEPLGEPAAEVAEWLRLRGTVGLCALQLGVLESMLRRTAEYANQRHQFDHPIGAFQAVRQRLADTYIDVEAVRLTMWQAAWCLAEGEPAAQQVATAKYWAAEAGHRVAHAAVHLHGGVGIDVDYPLHQYFTAAKRNEFALGGATAQLRALGEDLAAEQA